MLVRPLVPEKMLATVFSRQRRRRFRVRSGHPQVDHQFAVNPGRHRCADFVPIGEVFDELVANSLKAWCADPTDRDFVAQWRLLLEEVPTGWGYGFRYRSTNITTVPSDYPPPITARARYCPVRSRLCRNRGHPLEGIGLP